MSGFGTELAVALAMKRSSSRYEIAKLESLSENSGKVSFFDGFKAEFTVFQIES
jgi:hypothetical protein